MTSAPRNALRRSELWFLTRAYKHSVSVFRGFRDLNSTLRGQRRRRRDTEAKALIDLFNQHRPNLIPEAARVASSRHTVTFLYRPSSRLEIFVNDGDGGGGGGGLISNYNTSSD